MKELFVDTTVLTFASGGPHPLRSACRSLVADVAAGKIEMHASVEAVQELLFHRLRREDRSRAVTQARHLASSLRLHDFDSRILERAISLVATSRLRGRDAVHAATALEAGFTEIVSADSDFDGVPGLTRVDPTDLDLTAS